MRDEMLSETAPQARPRRGRGALLGVALGCFALGAVLAGLVAWLAGPQVMHLVGHQSAAAPATAPAVAVPVPVANATLAQRGFDERLAALEQRMARIDLQATAASGNAARAEGLLIAFAARRAIDQGAPLGVLADQLRVRFADAQPKAVAAVIAAAAKPVTLDQLTARLQAMAPALTGAAPDESAWTRVKREVSTLFVIRHDNAPSPDPAARLERTVQLLREGRIDDAIADVQRLPAAANAQAWIDNARRYETAHRALDLIETTALIEPRRLNDANGHAVQQPSPLAEQPTDLQG